MKIIDLLNMIANGEIDEGTIIEFDNGYNDYCSVRVFFDRYIMDKENLNLKIKLKEDNNKIEKLQYHNSIPCEDDIKDYKFFIRQVLKNENFLMDKINEIIDKINNVEE